MLAAAKAREQTKPAGPPIKHEPTKVLTKKERLELRAQASGKKTAVSTTTVQAKVGALKGVKADVKEKEKDRRKPAEPTYQGTARPAKAPVQLAYRGTARPGSTVTGPALKPGAATQAKAKQRRVNEDGYLDWSDVGEDDDIEEEDGYESSDMEAGGLWDIEEEEARALRAAKQEDAEALKEEMEHKRQKEERKKKLAALSKAAAGKRKF